MKVIVLTALSLESLIYSAMEVDNIINDSFGIILLIQFVFQIVQIVLLILVEIIGKRKNNANNLLISKWKSYLNVMVVLNSIVLFVCFINIIVINQITQSNQQMAFFGISFLIIYSFHISDMISHITLCQQEIFQIFFLAIMCLELKIQLFRSLNIKPVLLIGIYSIINVISIVINRKEIQTVQKKGSKPPSLLQQEIVFKNDQHLVMNNLKKQDSQGEIYSEIFARKDIYQIQNNDNNHNHESRQKPGNLHETQNEPINCDQDLQIAHTIIEEISKLGVIIFNDSGNIIYNNEKVVQMFDCQNEVLINKIISKICGQQEDYNLNVIDKKHEYQMSKSLSLFRQKLKSEYQRISVNEENSRNNESNSHSKSNFNNNNISQAINHNNNGPISNNLIYHESSMLEHHSNREFLFRSNNTINDNLDSEKRIKSEENIINLIKILERAIFLNEHNKQKKKKVVKKGMGDLNYLSVVMNKNQTKRGKKYNKSNDKFKEELQLDIMVQNLFYKMKIGVAQAGDRSELLVILFEKQQKKQKKRNEINLFSHQLRSPLNCSIGLLQILQNSKIDAEIKRKYVMPSLISNKYLLNNINLMIDLMEIDIKEFQLEIQKINLYDIAQETIRMFKEQGNQKNLQINLISDIQQTDMWSDAQRIKQVLINLLSNSIKFSNPNGLIEVEVVVKNNTKFQHHTLHSFDQNVSHQQEKQLSQKGLTEIELAAKNNRKFQLQTLHNLDQAVQNQQEKQFSQNQVQVGLSEISIEENYNHEYSVRIQDYGVGINQKILQSILFKDEEEDDQEDDKNTSFAVESGEYDQTQLHRSRGFGIKSSVQILNTLCDQKKTQYPLKITSQINQGCCYQFSLIDFRDQLRLEEKNLNPDLSKRPSWVDFNITQKKIFLPQNSFSRNSPEVQIASMNENHQSDSNAGEGEWENITDSSHSLNRLQSINTSINMQEKMTVKTNRSNEDDDDGNIHFIGEERIIQIDSQIKDIMIVDDNEFNILTLEFIFEQFSVAVDKAFNGKEAVDLFQKGYHINKRPYKLIFMDIDMPVQNGFQASREIIEFCHQQLIDTTIVACTAFLGPQDMEKAQLVGMKQYIAKPVTQSLVEEVYQQYVHY